MANGWSTFQSTGVIWNYWGVGGETVTSYWCTSQCRLRPLDTSKLEDRWHVFSEGWECVNTENTWQKQRYLHDGKGVRHDFGVLRFFGNFYSNGKLQNCSNSHFFTLLVWIGRGEERCPVLDGWLWGKEQDHRRYKSASSLFCFSVCFQQVRLFF